MVAEIEATKKKIFHWFIINKQIVLVTGMIYACNVERWEGGKAGGSEFKVSIVYIANLSQP